MKTPEMYSIKETKPNQQSGTASKVDQPTFLLACRSLTFAYGKRKVRKCPSIYPLKSEYIAYFGN